MDLWPQVSPVSHTVTVWHRKEKGNLKKSLFIPNKELAFLNYVTFTCQFKYTLFILLIMNRVHKSIDVSHFYSFYVLSSTFWPSPGNIIQDLSMKKTMCVGVCALYDFWCVCLIDNLFYVTYGIVAKVWKHNFFLCVWLKPDVYLSCIKTHNLLFSLCVWHKPNSTCSVLSQLGFWKLFLFV